MPAATFYQPIEKVLSGKCEYSYYRQSDGKYSKDSPSRICHVSLKNTNNQNTDVLMLIYTIRNQTGKWKIHSEGAKRFDQGAMIPTRNKALSIAKENRWKFVAIATAGEDAPPDDIVSKYFVSIESYVYGNDTVYDISKELQELESLGRPDYYRTFIGLSGVVYSLAFIKRDKLTEYLCAFDDRAYGNIPPLQDAVISSEETSIAEDIINHNLYGIHIKLKNDALSEENPHICIGWSKIGDLSVFNTKEELADRYSDIWPDAKIQSKGQNVGQLWRFYKEIEVGDYVIFADGEVCHVGRVESDYTYDTKIRESQDPDYTNNRKVVWLKKNINRADLSEVLHHSLMTAMSIWAMNDYRASVVDLLSGTYKKDSYDGFEESSKTVVFTTGLDIAKSRNRIIFGAPGTGKSFLLDKERKDLLGVDNETDYERVTFHPDYSYANFVGTYKPVMVSNRKPVEDKDTDFVISILNDKGKTAQEKYDVLYERFKDDGLTRLPMLLGLYTDEMFKTRKQDGTDAAGDNSVERNHGKAIRKYVSLLTGLEASSDIAYEYVPGPFMRVYVNALKSARSANPKPYLLIIEEINRANVAAVFGDIFQLLDRNEDGVSEYPIQASEDMKKYLAKELECDISEVEKIRIPDNMFIWATMNSADQGVFPMDTAFKRRWDFTYIGIDDNDEDIRGKYVVVGSESKQKIEWNELRKAINEFLAEEKINEDKQLGPYFISRKITVPSGTDIDAEKFAEAFKNKVLMYLFDDAAKQKREKLFEGISKGKNRYSEICKAFDEQGIGIFNGIIQGRMKNTKDLRMSDYEIDKNGLPIKETE